ncbi:MAG: thiamine-binding protein [Chitinophagaceae bacterium]
MGDEVIAVIQRSGTRFEVGPFTTILEGIYQEIMNVIHAVNEHLVTKDCKEWTSDIQLRVRNDGDITGDEKTIKFR